MMRATTSLAAKAALLLGSLWLAPAVTTTVLAQGAGSGSGSASGREAVAPKAVLELYTSQGCSSCPPADALLQTYANRSDVVALTLPVDYWDYLGWKDTLASPKFSARQRAYAKHRGDGRIYTPQMVINGQTHTIGSGQREIDGAIAATATTLAKSRVAITLRGDGAQLVIEAASAPEGSELKEANLWLAVIQREAEIVIRSGENRGRTVKYFNVVRDLAPIGMWEGKPMTVRIDKDTVAQSGADSFAVLLQNGKAGPIVGAAMLAK